MSSSIKPPLTLTLSRQGRGNQLSPLPGREGIAGRVFKCVLTYELLSKDKGELCEFDFLLMRFCYRLASGKNPGILFNCIFSRYRYTFMDKG